MNKKVANIVFYKFNSNNEDIVKACVFYNDGTVKNVSKQEAVKEAIKIAKEEKSIKDLTSLINKNRIYAMSGSELTKRFNEFVSYDIVENHIDNALDNIVLTDTDKVVAKDNNPAKTTIIPIEYDLINQKVNELNKEQELTEEEDIINDNEIILEDDIDNNNKEVSKVTPVVVSSEMINKNNDLDEEEDLLEEDLEDTVVRMNNETNNTPVTPVVEKETEKSGILSKVKNFVKGKLLPVAVAASLIAGTGVGYSLAKDHKLGAVSKTSIASALDNEEEEKEVEIEAYEAPQTENVKAEDANKENTTASSNSEQVEIDYANNDYYNGLTYDELLEKTTNPIQKEVMQNISEALDWFNGDFADAYVEEGKDIRAALTWDEMVALQIAYNDYDKHMLHAIFNGAEIESNELENAYKNATLQLMGAYVIEQEPNLVDVTKFVHNEEGIKFVQKYQNMLEAAKNAEGEEKLRLIEAFYSELYKDFPITDEVRTEGISHSDYRTVESYKLAVAPMVAAAEIMFQNYEIDHTLTDKAIEYFNDLGLCNIAEKKFDRVEIISLTNCEYDETNPLYEQFKNAKIIELKNKGIYVIDDEHRDLSQLDRFQELVNWHFKMVDGHFELETWYTTETYTTKKTWTETHKKTWTETTKTKTNDRDKAVEEAGEKKVKEAEEKVDKEIEEENKKAKEKGEKEAEENRKKMQEEADKHKKDLEKTVEEDNKDMQEDINDANNKDKNGEKVNEDDFGDHNVTFDDEDKDKDGNKSDSVKDLTTDGTDADKDLGDPNETGKAFDEEGQKMDPEINYDVEENQEIDRTETPEENTNNNNNNDDSNSNENNNENNDNSNDTTNDNNNDLGDPSDFDNNTDYSDENNYDVEYDDEIDYSEDEVKHEEPKQEAPKQEEKHEEPKQEAPKQEEKHEEPKQEAPKEEKHEEPKQEAPKQEEKHEEPKQEAPKQEEKHEEPKQEAPKEEKHEESSSKSNEQAVNDYVENLAKASEEETAKELVLG